MKKRTPARTFHLLDDDSNITCDPRRGDFGKEWPDDTQASYDREHVTCPACLAAPRKEWDGRESDAYHGSDL